MILVFQKPNEKEDAEADTTVSCCDWKLPETET